MIVRSGVVLCVAAVLGAAFCNSVRAEDGRPSRETLAAMGLGSLTVMSDEEGLAVRGHGYKGGGSSVSVWGSSFATINGGPAGGAHSENGYLATGKHKASGSNSSYAGVAIITKGGHKPGGGHGGGGYGDGGGYGQPTRGGNYKPRGNNYGGGGYGGGGHGGHGNVKVTSITFFAGGHSSAWAW